MEKTTTITKEAQYAALLRQVEESRDATILRRAIAEKLPATGLSELFFIYGFLKETPARPLEQLPLEELRAAFPHPSIDDAADLAIEPAEAKSQYWRINLIVREAYCRGFAAGVYDAQEAARLTIEEMAESN